MIFLITHLDTANLFELQTDEKNVDEVANIAAVPDIRNDKDDRVFLKTISLEELGVRLYPYLECFGIDFKPVSHHCPQDFFDII